MLASPGYFAYDLSRVCSTLRHSALWSSSCSLAWGDGLLPYGRSLLTNQAVMPHQQMDLQTDTNQWINARATNAIVPAGAATTGRPASTC